MSSYTLIRSHRRTLALQINPAGELIVRAPMKVSIHIIEDFIERKKDWIHKHQSRIQKLEMKHPKKEYRGSEILEIKNTLQGYLIPRIEELWIGKNLPKYTSIKITKSERRWGSCSGKNGLCFSYRLIEFLDTKKEFIDAIIIHELAHLKEKNHQKPFWNLVYNWMPEYKMILEKYRSRVED